MSILILIYLPNIHYYIIVYIIVTCIDLIYPLSFGAVFIYFWLLIPQSVDRDPIEVHLAFIVNNGNQ